MDQEALLPFDDKPPNNNIQNFVNVEKNKQKTLTLRNKVDKFQCRFLCILTFVYALITTLYILIQMQIIPYWIQYILLFVFIGNVFCTIPFVLSVRKVELIKNPYLNLITLIITKKCGCSKQYTIMLENKYLLYQRDLILLNTINNPSEIDLDSSNIQKCPINLIYRYEENASVDGTLDETQLKINEFLGQQKYENTIYDEINKYITIYQKNYLKDHKKVFDIYMKMNEYFYTFFYSDSSLDFRTDFIYSNDFERLFIGKVNNDAYSKTLLINLNEINTFEMFEEIKKEDGRSYSYGFLKILYKNNQKEEIKICENKKLYLEKFVLLLNGKLNDINEMKKNNNNNNSTPQH